MSEARRKRRADERAVKAKSRPADSGVLVSPWSPASGLPLSFVKAGLSGRALWVSLGLIAANALVYAPVRHYEFVSFDDTQYVVENLHVTGGLSWSSVSWAFTTGYFANWHPLTWLSHMLDAQLYGLNAGPHHLTNLLFHIVNTVLLFGLLHRMTGALGRSAFVAGLFAVHPLHVESVVWVAERKDVLSTLFWMLTMWAYVSYVRQPRPGRYFLVLLWFALGLMSKPMLVTLPFVLLLLDFWPLDRLSLGAHSARSSLWASLRDQRLVWLQLAREKLPLMAVAVASSIVTFVVQRRGGAVSGLDEFPLSLRVGNALVSYIAYIGQMLWPTRLAAFYPYPRSLPGGWIVGSGLILIGVSVVVIRAARRHPYLPVGWFWYVGTLLPVIGFIQVGGQSRADRYTYVPLIGLFIIVAWGIGEMLARWRYRSTVLPVCAGLLILACAITARGQVQYWANSKAYWEHAMEVTAENYLAHYGLGDALLREGKRDEAIAQFTEALRLKPDYREAYLDLGIALADQGRFSEAIAQYTEALRLKPDYAEAHLNLGNALRDQGRAGEAVSYYTEALRLKPDYAEAHNNLGAALVAEGKTDEAMAQYTEALRLKPDYAEAHSNLGAALVEQGKVDEGIAEYTEALRLKPDYAEAHNNLAIVLSGQGNVAKAVAHYSEALRIRPDYAEAHLNLGVDLASQGRVEEAITQYTEALRIRPDYALAHYNLGVALSKQGRVGEAIHEFTETLRISPGNREAQLMLDELSRGKRSGPRTP